MPQLYGRDAVLLHLVPRLIGLAHDSKKRVPPEYTGDMPVVLLTGRHGSGRTAVLEDLDQAYRGRLPLARWDFGREGRRHRRSPEAEDVSNTSPVVEMLEELVTTLAPGAPQYGRIGFPRLLPGLFAVSSWHRGNGAEREVARQRIGRLLTACFPRHTKQGPDSGGVWLREIKPKVDDGNGLQSIAEVVVDRYLDLHTSRREGRLVRDWHRRRAVGAADGAAQDGANALLRLCLRFHLGGDFRHAVERILTEAFLDDLTDSYGAWKRYDQTPRPLVLLDDVHTGSGRHALELLLEQRADPTRERPDPLVVVATRLGEGTRSHPHATRRRLPETVAESGWHRTVQGEPSAGLLSLPLPPLRIDDQLAMLDDTPHPLHPYLPTALHRLTRGNALGSRVLCDAVVAAAASGTVPPEGLLELSGPGGRRVTELILEGLLPSAPERARLVQLCVAWDLEAAEVLARTRTDSAADSSPAATAHAYLERDGWNTDGEGQFVGDPFLRALLIQELRTTSAVEGSGGGHGWTTLHRTLQEHHDGRGASEEPLALRHALAGGDARFVVSRLAGRFEEWDAPRWLTALRTVAGAPHPPRDVREDRRRETARGSHDSDLGEAGLVERSVNRLLHALWYLAEEVVEPTEEMCDDLGAELTFLSMRHPDGHAVLNRASREWPEAARRKQTLPVGSPP